MTTPPHPLLKQFVLAGLLLGITLPASSADNRTIIWLEEGEKTLLMKEMRQFLAASQKILAASLNDDMETIKKTARRVGIQQMRATPVSLREKLPKHFMALGPKVHQGFEDIAYEAETMGDSAMILERLANLQQTCISCHATYQIKLSPNVTSK